jgi:hypothetical protein
MKDTQNTICVTGCPSCGALVQAIDEFDGKEIKVRYRLLAVTKKPSRGKRVFRAIKSIVIIAVCGGLMWVGVNGNHKAWNLFVFTQWLITLLLLLLYAAKDDPRAGTLENIGAPALPIWMLRLSDFLTACFLAAFGHFFYASLSIGQLFLESAVYAKSKPNGQEPARAEQP